MRDRSGRTGAQILGTRTRTHAYIYTRSTVLQNVWRGYFQVAQLLKITTPDNRAMYQKVLLCIGIAMVSVCIYVCVLMHVCIYKKIMLINSAALNAKQP